MSSFIVKEAKIYYDELDISGILASANLAISADIKDDTTLGDGTRSRIAGLLDSQVSCSGFWDSAEDLKAFTKIGAATPAIISVAPETAVAGDRAYTVQVDEASYSTFDAVGELLPFNVEASGTGTFVRGIVAAIGAKTADGNSVAFNLGAVATGDKLFASLHVVANDGSGNQTLDVVIASDDDGTFDSASTNRIVFTQVTSNNTSEMKSVNGAITDTFWRAEWDVEDDSAGTPSYTIFLVIGIWNKP